MAVVPDIRRWHHSTFYREAVENVVAYNLQLMRERKSRLPYVDAQTGIAQSDCRLWHSRLERRSGNLPGQIYSYLPARWRRETRPRPPPGKVSAVQTVVQGSSPAAGLIQTVEGGVVTKRSSRIAGMSRKETEVPGVAMSVSVRVTLESPVSSEMNEEEESPEADLDYVDEYDSEEERRQRRRKKSCTTKSKSSSGGGSHRSTKDQDRDKPYPCNFCSRRYKTASSLKAHTTQYHSGEPIRLPHPPTSFLVPPLPKPLPKQEVKVPVHLSPPPNMKGKGYAKPNPYCDFCLGDNSCNKKISKPENMVSCADCGRSGHPSCMQFSERLAAVVHTYRWQCIECKSCHFCGTSENDDQLLFCDDCDRGYHMYCLKPPIKEPPEGSWSCGMCLRPASEVTTMNQAI